MEIFMIAYSRYLNLYPIFTAIGLVLALFLGLGFYNQYPQNARACFFVGNGAYYALSAQESTTTPPVDDFYKNPHEFLTNFQPDSIICDTARALFEKEQNIFLTYKTWTSFIRLLNRIKSLFASVGISEPLKQIYIKDTHEITASLEKQLKEKLIVNNIRQTDLKQETAKEYAPLLFFPDKKITKDILSNKLITNYCGALHPDFAKVFHFLYIFNPSEWRMFDTKTGLFYLTPQSSPYMPIQTSHFKQIDPATAQTEDFIQQESWTKEYEWTTQLDQIFTPSSTAWQLYVTGHGNSPIADGDTEVEKKLFDTGSNTFYMYAWMAGMRSEKFAPFLKFIDSKLNTDTIFINSCFASAERVKKLLGKKEAPSFNIISPIATTYNSVSNYVFPLYTKTYIPAWLTEQQTPYIQNEVRDNNDPNEKPFGINKYENLFKIKDKKKLAENINLFFREKEGEAPSLIAAHQNNMEKLTT